MASALMQRVPPLTVVMPVYVFVPLSVSWPRPIFTRPAVPLIGALIVAAMVSSTLIVLSAVVAPPSNGC